MCLTLRLVRTSMPSSSSAITSCQRLWHSAPGALVWANSSTVATRGFLARKPRVAAVDEFAHTNAPGAECHKRWQDVMALLDEGIDVLTSLNVKHIESMNDQVWHVTVIRVRETVPEWVVQEADEV